MIPEMLQDSNVHLMSLLEPYLIAIIILLGGIEIALWFLYRAYKKRHPVKKEPTVFIEKDYHKGYK